MEKATRLKTQLERLLAQDLSEMGHQAKILHQQRIEELEALCTPTSDDDSAASTDRRPQTTRRPSAR